MISIKHGDIFTFQVTTGKYISGRIILDIKEQCIEPNLLKANSTLNAFSESILVEIYSGLSQKPEWVKSKVLIPGILVEGDLLKTGEWEIIDYSKIDPTRVEFPETLILFEGQALFERGEISLHLSLDYDDLRRINVYPTFKSAKSLPDICLYYLNLKHLINDDFAETKHLKNSDLRFSEYRHEIYHLLNEDEHQSYFEMSSRLGYYITRFYK